MQFSYIGMKTMEKQVSAATRIDLKMESDAQMVEEVVVVAYGTRKKGTIAGAVSTVKAEKWKMYLRPVSTNHCRDRPPG